MAEKLSNVTKKAIIIAWCLLPILYGCGNNKRENYDIRNFGARPDAINTDFINEAITQCHKDGGGRVTIPAGTFRTGTVILLSNVELHLSAGAKLIGSNDTSDYKPMPLQLFREGYNRYGLIYAVDAKNISITGVGEINGNGTYFMNGLDKPHMGHDWDRQYVRQQDTFMKSKDSFEDGPVSYDFRPGMMLTIERCENILITDVQLNDTPEWTVRLQDCDNAIFRGVRITTNPLIPNSDGIHCTNSRNVQITGCNISAGDDAVIVSGFGDGVMPGEVFDAGLVGNKTGYAENIVVTNCVLSSRSSCIRVGYGHHPIRNLIFSNLIMHESNRGIGVYARSNSNIKNVLFENIVIGTRLHAGHWWGKGEPIHVSSLRDDGEGAAPIMDNIQFSNIIASGEAGILVYGTEESVIKNISFNNITLTIKKGKHSENYGGNFDLRPASSKSQALFMHEIPALYAQHVENISLADVAVTWNKPVPAFFTNALEVNHFEGLKITNFTGDPAASNSGLFSLKLSNGKKSELTIEKGISIIKKNVE